MTSTLNPTSTSKAVAEWCKVFKTQATENYTSSMTFMKQLTVVAISVIAYLKDAFPEENFTVETLCGLKLKILKKKCNDESAQFLSTALLQSFEALDKKYLHQLALCFYEDECKLENLIEYHIFEYSYNSDGVSMNIHSKSRNSQARNLKCTFEDVRRKTMELIKTCVVMMQACPQLPENCDISIRLYYNDDAPEGYQAPGYQSDYHTEDHLESTLHETVRLGWVETPYHKLIARSYTKDNIRDSYEANPTQNPPMVSLSQQEAFTEEPSKSPVPGIKLKCPCKKYEDVGAYDPPVLVTCVVCGTAQHAVCFGLIGATAAASSHRCHVCDSGELSGLTERQRESLCVYRRTLDWCTSLGSIAGMDLVRRYNISELNAYKLMKLLALHKVIQLDSEIDLTTPRKINREMLNHEISQNFKTSEETDLADRLLAETFASQESVHDPVGEVLSPLEKVSLHNANKLGRIVENVTMETNNDDDTLRQYREAVLASGGINEDIPMVKDIVGIEPIVGKRKIDETEGVGKRLRSGNATKRVKRNK